MHPAQRIRLSSSVPSMPSAHQQAHFIPAPSDATHPALPASLAPPTDRFLATQFFRSALGMHNCNTVSVC